MHGLGGSSTGTEHFIASAKRTTYPDHAFVPMAPLKILDAPCKHTGVHIVVH